MPPIDPPNWGNGKYVFELFPPEYIALNLELNNIHYHPKLAEILAKFPDDEIDMKLAQIASYCEVMMDGVYDLDSRIQLCRVLLERLKILREDPNASVIITIN